MCILARAQDSRGPKEARMKSNVEIRFPEPSSASVSIEHAHKAKFFQLGDHRQRADSLLFACYLLRQFHNLGRHPTAQALSDQLRTWMPSGQWEHGKRRVLSNSVLMRAALNINLDYERARRKYGTPINLVESTHDGSRRFVGRLVEKGGGYAFFLDLKGFGLGRFLGADMPQYATDSSILFMAKLAYDHEADEMYFPKLQSIANDCGLAWRSGRITMRNQENLAFGIISHSFQVNITELLPRSTSSRGRSGR